MAKLPLRRSLQLRVRPRSRWFQPPVVGPLVERCFECIHIYRGDGSGGPACLQMDDRAKVGLEA